ncbi:MAG: DUF6470 family protein [Oscillospiraceae bacterium]|nr:DUF6470 family protein [Oscillospiraceae bacterium]
MKPLLEIKSVPIVLEYKVNNARMQRVDSNATLEITKNSGGYRMRSRPISVNVDTMESNRRPMPRVYASNPRDRASQAGNNAPPRQNVSPATYSATSRVLENGRVQVNMQFNDKAVAEIESRIGSAIDPGAGFVPGKDESLSFPENLSIIYEIDKMSFDWSASMKNFELEFIPGSIEFSVSEYPSLTIEYVGDPIYVPPSANPNVIKSMDKVV